LGDDTIQGVQTLEQLERKNLFVVPLDSHRTWYRYHHLFAELLRHTLHRVEPDRLTEYHYRAAQWYEQQGYVAEAIEHAIAARAFEYAASLIEQEIQTNEHPRFDAIALRNALAELPPQLTDARPWLLVASSWAAFTSSQFMDAVLAIQTLEQLLNKCTDSVKNIDQLWGLVIALKGMQARQQGNTAESVAFMEKALQLLPQDHSWLRSLILLNLGVTYFVADNYESAKPLLPEVSRIGQARGIADPAIAGLYLQAQFLALRGRLQEAIALCQKGLDLATQRRWLATYAGVLVQVALADLLREQNDLEVAVEHLNESIDRAIQNQQPGLMMGYITLARVHQAQGNWQAAWDAIHAAKQCQPWLWSTILSVEGCQVRLHLAQGNLEAAMAWVQSRNLGVEDELCYSSTQRHPIGSELDYLTFARILIAYGRTRASKSHLQDAMRLLSRLYEFTKAGGRTIRTMETLILQALAWQAWGDGERAIACLKQALEIPRQGDYIRLFVDEGQPMAQLLRQAASKNIYFNDVNRLLATFGSVEANSLVPVQALIEPLSDRELEVLQNLATGMSNQAIADQLFVSLAAVKWHARNIYGKLEVSNRTQAVARARELGIL
jgi:LuxR family maltose regulon positive regulatory protein